MRRSIVLAALAGIVLLMYSLPLLHGNSRPSIHPLTASSTAQTSLEDQNNSVAGRSFSSRLSHARNLISLVSLFEVRRLIIRRLGLSVIVARNKIWVALVFGGDRVVTIRCYEI